MASIFKRKLKQGNGFTWRAVVRLTGYRVVCESFERKQEAEDWGKDTERRIRLGQFNFDQHNVHNTFTDLYDQFIQDGALEHHRSQEDTLRHLAYWKERLGSYGLIHLSSDLIGKERQLLLETPSSKGKKRASATVNRYMASLFTILTYASKKLEWISKNPCLSLMKLKESSGCDRVLSAEEIQRLLEECRKSKSRYLYPVVLISISTGARQGEILNLEWKHVNFDNKIAYLKETKNGRPRSIFLIDPIIEELRKLYQERDSLKSLVFASKTAFGRVDIKKAWQEALKRAGILDCRAHDMRHTFATLAANHGASNLELATAMGHRTLQMLQRYTRAMSNLQKIFRKRSRLIRVSASELLNHITSQLL